MGRFIDLTGQRFGRWTVLYRGEDVIDKDGRPRIRWHCRCDCGTERDVAGNMMKLGYSRSCGCLQKEVVSAKGSPNKSHGMSGTRLHRVWKNMNNRCNNPNAKKYERYGGRGIKVCEEWSGKNGFANFHKWAIGNGYAENLTIDRIDNDGDYSPINCRWVDWKTQGNNKSDNRRIKVDGEIKTIAEWADYLGISRWRLYYHGDEETAKIIKRYLAG